MKMYDYMNVLWKSQTCCETGTESFGSI